MIMERKRKRNESMRVVSMMGDTVVTVDPLNMIFSVGVSMYREKVTSY